MLNKEEIRRYSRHLKLDDFGLRGQESLKSSKVLVIGAGGLGSPCLLYLAAAGVGTIGIIDADTVDESNLQRQIVHNTSTVGKLKVESAATTLSKLNPLITIETYAEFLNADNALYLFSQYDLIIDGCDSLAVRYLINDACVKLSKPFVYGSIYRFDGQISILAAENGPCYRCLYPEPPESIPSCSEAGVLGVLPGIIGVTQATEAIKYLAGMGKPLVGQLLLMDALTNEYSTLSIKKDPHCPACGHWSLQRLGDTPDISCEVANPVKSDRELEPAHVPRYIQDNGAVLIDVRHDYEFQYSSLPGARHMSLAEILAGKYDEELLELSKDPIVLYCLGGVRSMKALNHICKISEDKGPVTIHSMSGGIKKWAKEVENIEYFQ